jgi:hypothetical protein
VVRRAILPVITEVCPGMGFLVKRGIAETMGKCADETRKHSKFEVRTEANRKRGLAISPRFPDPNNPQSAQAAPFARTERIAANAPNMTN